MSYWHFNDYNFNKKNYLKNVILLGFLCVAFTMVAPLVSGSSICNAYSFNVSNICYSRSDDVYTTVASARDYCWNSLYTGTSRAQTQPDLAYTAINSHAIRINFWYNYRVRRQYLEETEQNELWLGIQREHAWNWIEGNHTNTIIAQNYVSMFSFGIICRY